MSVVRPVAARLVRPEVAAHYVSRMLDALPAADRAAAVAAQRAGVDPDAYAEADPAFYVYSLRRDDASHVGIVGDVRTAAFLDGQVRGHEAVQPERVAGLVEHFTSAIARPELVALLHEPSPDVISVLAETVRTDPLLRFTGPDDWEQTVWRVPSSATTALAGSLSRAVHYVADGHHRVAAGVSVWDRDGRPDDAGVMCVMYPLDGLRLLAFHRRLSGPVSADEVLPLLTNFSVRPVAHPHDVTGCFGLYVDGGWHDAAFTGVRSPGVAGLDVALLDHHVLAALPPARLSVTSALSDVDELTRMCDEDRGALFTLRPPTLAQLTEVADRGEVMPPKTTYFDPKPYAGIFLR